MFIRINIIYMMKLIFPFLVCITTALPSGSPVCDVTGPAFQTAHGAETPDAGFSITVQPQSVLGEYNIVLTKQKNPIHGVLIYVVAGGQATHVGTFAPKKGFTNVQGCTGATITHSDDTEKTDTTFKWTAPSTDESYEVKAIVAGKKNPYQSLNFKFGPPPPKDKPEPQGVGPEPTVQGVDSGPTPTEPGVGSGPTEPGVGPEPTPTEPGVGPEPTTTEPGVGPEPTTTEPGVGPEPTPTEPGSPIPEFSQNIEELKTDWTNLVAPLKKLRRVHSNSVPKLKKLMSIVGVAINHLKKKESPNEMDGLLIIASLVALKVIKAKIEGIEASSLDPSIPGSSSEILPGDPKKLS